MNIKLKLYFFLMFLGILFFSCKKQIDIKPEPKVVVVTQSPQPILVPEIEYPSFSAEAHRGGTGIMPENTIIAMLNAISLPNVTTLEMDTHITKDGKVIVTHGDYLDPKIMLSPEGQEIPLSDAKKYPIFKMDYSDIRKFDIGTKYTNDYPQQRKIKTYLPLLDDLIDSVQTAIKSTNKKQIFYNIEIKSTTSGDNILNPIPEVFVKLLMDVIEKKNITKFVVIQSFDIRPLRIINEKYPLIKTSYLVSNRKSYEENIIDLGFKPFILSPSYDMVDLKMINSAHEEGVKIITWTVNSLEQIKKIKSLNVDGIITDYPNML